MAYIYNWTRAFRYQIPSRIIDRIKSIQKMSYDKDKPNENKLFELPGITQEVSKMAARVLARFPYNTFDFVENKKITGLADGGLSLHIQEHLNEGVNIRIHEDKLGYVVTKKSGQSLASTKEFKPQSLDSVDEFVKEVLDSLRDMGTDFSANPVVITNYKKEELVGGVYLYYINCESLPKVRAIVNEISDDLCKRKKDFSIDYTNPKKVAISVKYLVG